MENVQLGREVLDHVTAHPAEFDMRAYGKLLPCGTVACLAGHAMLLAGYTLTSSIFGRFRRPDGSVVQRESWEAIQLLGLAESEYAGLPSEPTLFSSCLRNHQAIERFREIVEKAEANQ